MPPQDRVSQRNASRERSRSAARMIPGFGAYQDGQDAIRRADQRANSRVSPEVAAQRAAAARVSRLQQMQQSLLAQGNQAEADQVGAILQSLQPQAAPGATIGAMVGQMGARRNAFAGMGQNRQGARPAPRQ